MRNLRGPVIGDHLQEVLHGLIPDSNGMIVLRDSPGLGVDVREDVIEKYRVKA